MAREIHIEPLTAEAFAPFGQVIEADHARSFLINEGRTRRYDALATPDAGENGTVVLSIFRGTPWPRPIRIRMLERHPLGSQAFVPMTRHPWLAVVAERPEPAACRAFLVRGDRACNTPPTPGTTRCWRCSRSTISSSSTGPARERTSRSTISIPSPRS